MGLAAVTTSIANYMMHDPATAMDTAHLVATYLGTFVGAVTLTGEIDAELNVARRWCSPQRHCCPMPGSVTASA